MKFVIHRVLTGWSFVRVLYLAVGIFIMVQSVIDVLWLGVIIGGYFSAMGLFGFGCASGACYTGSLDTELSEQKSNKIQEVEFEELKSK